MSDISLKLESGDIVLDGDTKLKLVQDEESLAQQYKVLLETNFESDFRDPTYGFRILELFNFEGKNLEDLISLYTKETLLQHPRTGEILEIIVTQPALRQWKVNAIIKINPTEEILNIGSEFNVE